MKRTHASGQKVWAVGTGAAAVILASMISFGSLSNARAEQGESWATEMLARAKPQSGASSRRASNGARASMRSRLGGPVTDDTPSRRRGAPRASWSGGGLTWQASSGCLSGQVRGVLADVASNFGPVTVTSTCRSVSQNRAAGGAGQSYHLRGEAVDFRTRGSTGAVYAYLSSNGGVGGLKHYGGGLFHVDTGPRRSW